MSTRPRMSAPIGRVQVKTSEGRTRRGSGVGRWSAAEPPREVETAEAEDAETKGAHPRFYPFAPRSSDDLDG